ncbi:hypothetical protein V6N13_049475 [Hibiscus sabdariffa]
MEDFDTCLGRIGLVDHSFGGPMFTWSNHQDQTFLARKLDRVLASTSWMECFPCARINFLAPGLSDHCPGVVCLENRMESTPKAFRFFNFWTKDPEFLEIVDSSWTLPLAASNPMSALFFMLKRLKPALKSLNQRRYGEITLKVKEKRSELERVQMGILSGNQGLIEQELNLLAELKTLLVIEDCF